MMIRNKLLLLKQSFTCPPYSHLSDCLTKCLCLIFAYLWLYSFDPESAIPANCSSSTRQNKSIHMKCHGGNLFSLFLLFIISIIFGNLFLLLRSPSVFGMLTAGFVLRNMPYINAIINVENIWSDHLRKMALCIILIKAGLRHDAAALKRLSCLEIRLAFIPCLTEAIIGSVMAHFLLTFSWGWSLILGFVLSAGSPTLVEPFMLDIEKKRLGTDKGVSALVVTGLSIDNIVCLIGFGNAIAITFAAGNSSIMNIFRGPMEVVAGGAYGTIVGLILWFLPSPDIKHSLFYRTMLLFVSSTVAIFGSTTFRIPGTGLIAVLTLAFVASTSWKMQRTWTNDSENPILSTIDILWWISQPLLFGLCGFEVNLQTVELTQIKFGILTLFIGLMSRVIVSFVVLFGSSLNLKEKVFISIARLPKATLQAALGPLALDLAIREVSPEKESVGRLVLAIAFISIFITAPIAAFVPLTAPVLLQKSSNQDYVEMRPADVKYATEESGRIYIEDETLT